MMAALEVLRRFSEEYNGRPPVTVRLVDWADEEGARFGRSLLGSSAFAGTHTIEADRVRTDKDGIRLEDALRRCGVEIDRFPEAQREQQNAAAYLELHIEQGPVLEKLGLPLGVVLGTKGVERHAITFHRTGGALRFDPDERAPRCAGTQLPSWRWKSGRLPRKHPNAVCTMGSVKTFPGIVTAVVGRCEATLDQRDLDAEVLAQMYREAREASQRFAAEENCTVEWSRIWSIEPVPFHPALIKLCEEAIQETVGPRPPPAVRPSA